MLKSFFNVPLSSISFTIHSIGKQIEDKKNEHYITPSKIPFNITTVSFLDCCGVFHVFFEVARENANF